MEPQGRMATTGTEQQEGRTPKEGIAQAHPTITQGRQVPIEEPATPIEETATPIKEKVTPIKEMATPTKENNLGAQVPMDIDPTIETGLRETQ